MSEILVVKLGGTTIADQRQVFAEIALVARHRPVVLVHGGGKRITEWLERLGVPSRFEGGLRVTDAAALEVAAAVLRGVVNSELVAGLHDLGVDAVGLSGVDGGLLVAERIPGMGLVAHVVGLRRDLLDAILVGGQVPVVAPLARDEDGIVCNVNADDAAAGIAAGLGARQLILLTDVDGIRDADGRRLDSLTSGEAEALIAALADHIVKPAFIYRHQWRAGDLLMWDNCSVQHRAIQDYDLPQRRLIHRTTMGGFVPM